MWRNGVAILTLAGSIAAAPAWAQSPADVETVTRELVCTCGCGNMIVANCACSEAQRVREQVAAFMVQGLSRDAILDRFAGLYGTEVLAAPPAEGFGLSAWILPFAAVAFGICFLMLRLRRWARTASTAPGVEQSGLDDQYEKMLEREIREA